MALISFVCVQSNEEHEHRTFGEDGINLGCSQRTTASLRGVLGYHLGVCAVFMFRNFSSAMRGVLAVTLPALPHQRQRGLVLLAEHRELLDSRIDRGLPTRVTTPLKSADQRGAACFIRE